MGISFNIDRSTKEGLAKKGKSTRTAYLKALNEPNVDDNETNKLRDIVTNLNKHVKSLSDGHKVTSAAATKVSVNSLSSCLKISKRSPPKFQLENNKAKPFANEDIYTSVDHFLSKFEKLMYSFWSRH